MHRYSPARHKHNAKEPRLWVILKSADKACWELRHRRPNQCEMPARVIIVIEYVYTTGLDRTGRRDRETDYSGLGQIHQHCDSRAHQFTSYILLYEWLSMTLVLMEVVLKI